MPVSTAANNVPPRPKFPRCRLAPSPLRLARPTAAMARNKSTKKGDKKLKAPAKPLPDTHVDRCSAEDIVRIGRQVALESLAAATKRKPTKTYSSRNRYDPLDDEDDNDSPEYNVGFSIADQDALASEPGPSRIGNTANDSRESIHTLSFDGYDTNIAQARREVEADLGGIDTPPLPGTDAPPAPSPPRSSNVLPSGWSHSVQQLPAPRGTVAESISPSPLRQDPEPAGIFELILTPPSSPPPPARNKRRSKRIQGSAVPSLVDLNLRRSASPGSVRSTTNEGRSQRGATSSTALVVRDDRVPDTPSTSRNVISSAAPTPRGRKVTMPLPERASNDRKHASDFPKSRSEVLRQGFVILDPYCTPCAKAGVVCTNGTGFNRQGKPREGNCDFCARSGKPGCEHNKHPRQSRKQRQKIEVATTTSGALTQLRDIIEDVQNEPRYDAAIRCIRVLAEGCNLTIPDRPRRRPAAPIVEATEDEDDDDDDGEEFTPSPPPRGNRRNLRRRRRT